MTDDGNLSDREKIDRASHYEEIRFYKRQQWGVTAAGVLLLGGFLNVLHYQHITVLDKLLAILLVVGGIIAALYYLEDLQGALGDVRKRLDMDDTGARTRGRDILFLFKLILFSTAGVVLWAIIFKLH